MLKTLDVGAAESAAEMLAFVVLTGICERDETK